MTRSNIFTHFVSGLAVLGGLGFQPARSAAPEKLYENLTDQVVLVESRDELGRPWKQGSGKPCGGACHLLYAR